MFVAMNQFRVVPEQAEAFERIWRERESHLAGVPGFQHFALLRGEDPGDYISHSIWASRAAFVAWTESEHFTQGHRQGSLAGILAGPPRIRLYDAVIEQAAAAPRA